MDLLMQFLPILYIFHIQFNHWLCEYIKKNQKVIHFVYDNELKSHYLFTFA